MIIKFLDKECDSILEVEKKGDKVELFIYDEGENELGRSIKLSIKDVKDLIQYLQSVNLFQ